ncbi:MAG: O-methyltransferase [Lachnospiraceae bacterium]|nr:O-methyltransferase [Lachnospiraceae bacterium]
MFEEERIESFLRAFSKGFPEYIEELEEKAKAADIPIIRKDTQELLRVLLSLKKPKKILEIGTAVGFSSLLMAEYTEDDCKITTIENYPPRIEEAKNNFSKFDKKGKINFLEGDAGEIIKNMQDEYDLIFLDGPKGQYENYLDDLLRMLPSGGLLITDNILKEGEIVESRFAVTRRNRTIHSRMREYLLRLRDEEILENVILPTGDGMTLSVKK